MPARQGFQFDPMAAKAQIGYGAAQVVDPGYKDIIDADAKRRQLELAEDKYKKEQADKNKPPTLEAGKLVPALQEPTQRAIKEFYEDYKENSATWDAATKAQEISKIKNFIQANKTASEMAFAKNNAWDKSKRTRNEDGLSRLFNADLLTGKELDQIDWTDLYKGINDFSQYNFVDLNDTVTDLTNIASYNAESGKYEILDEKKGMFETTSFERVDKNLAKEILTAKWKSLSTDPDTVQNAIDQINEDPSLSDKQKETYKSTPKGLLDWYTRQENIDLLTKDTTETSLQEAKDSKKYTWGWQDPKKFNFAYSTDAKEDRLISPKGSDWKPKGDGSYAVGEKTPFEEIRMARTDVPENKEYNITDPDDPEKKKDLFVVPLGFRRYEGQDTWMLIVDEKIPQLDEDGNEIINKRTNKPQYEYKTREIPYKGSVKGDIMANFGDIDPDDYMENVVNKDKPKEETKKTINW
jgi:hypothetical protein